MLSTSYKNLRVYVFDFLLWQEAENGKGVEHLFDQAKAMQRSQFFACATFPIRRHIFRSMILHERDRNQAPTPLKNMASVGGTRYMHAIYKLNKHIKNTKIQTIAPVSWK